MKKMLAFVLLLATMNAFVACSSNPAIEAAEEFLEHPTVENLIKIEKLEGSLSAEEIEEYSEWAKEHEDEIMEAALKAELI